MLDNITNSHHVRFAELKDFSFFLAVPNSDVLFYKLASSFSPNCNTFRLINSESNHGHSHEYAVEFVTVAADTWVQPVELVHVDIKYRVL